MKETVKRRLEKLKADGTDYVDSGIGILPFLQKRRLVGIFPIAGVNIRRLPGLDLALRLLQGRNGAFMKVPDELEAFVYEVQQVHGPMLHKSGDGPMERLRFVAVTIPVVVEWEGRQV
jgi:hypothetical protein